MANGNLKFELKQSFKDIANGADSEKRAEVTQYLIETLSKDERNKRAWVQAKLKEDEQRLKARKAEIRKVNAAERIRKKRLKDFKDAMQRKHNFGYGQPDFLKDEPFALITTQVVYKNLFSLEGDFLTRATDIQFGKDGFIYTHDKLYEFHALLHYDLMAKKLNKLQFFVNLKEFKFKVYELDPDGMLGFNLKLYPFEIEEYRVSKLTPEELQAEQKEKERIAEERRLASRTQFDDELDALFN